MQNRLAQRRFRERKEERQQKLEQAAASLEEKCKQLSEEYKEKSQEIVEILKEKQTLTAELDNLRNNWRLMLLLLQQPNGRRALTMFLGGEGAKQSEVEGPSAFDSGHQGMPLQ
jgi:chromosome segregation ATPase